MQENETKVFERVKSEGVIISSMTYNFIIGIVLLWGIFANWLMVKSIPPETIYKINFWLFMLGYFASCYLGVYLFNKSTNPVVSFLGYNFVVVPFGFIINIVVSRYNTEIVLEAIRITGFVTFTMMLVGTFFPIFFKKISSTLAIALLIVIVVESFEIFFPKNASQYY
jgi:FtsH-binding integral membrane protein